MSIHDRPYAGTWTLNNRKVIRYTPDALVYVNGDLALPGCPTCNGRIDLQKYITQISVDPSTAPPCSAGISLHIPMSEGHAFYRDGQFLLHPGLEINVYMRGYFPVKGLLSSVSPEEAGGIDVTKAVTYPYYHVFRGVLTEVTHEYNGGDHTVSMSCADLLHFWQYQRLATNGSVFGSRPSGSKVQTSLTGHNLSKMTPYSIVYTLWKDTMGAAGGVDFALSQETNAAAMSTSQDQSLFSMTQLYWQKRFGQTMASLRMYGVDGTLYNSVQQAFLARLTSEQAQGLVALRFADKTAQDKRELEPFERVAKAINFDPFSLWVAPEAEKAAAAGGAGLSVTQMQAFVTDISTYGQVNLWETEYQTKMDIISELTTLTGFEFFQDVDGDFVFKPPFYNLDTSSSRAYVIKPIDVINFTVKEGEPEATAVKATGSIGRNLKGIGLEGEWGKRAEYIDFRLVAQFGWRGQTFETEYYSDPRAMFFACVNRLDLFNISMNSATCTIPLRPELRPGFPVYIEHMDCFYYLQSFSHSFSFGGQCTTTLNLVGKRAKFFAPGVPPLSRRASINDIRLDNPHLPKLPLEMLGYDDMYRYQGFPNVVLALDPELLNPLFLLNGANLSTLEGNPEDIIQGLIRMARSGRAPILTEDPHNAPSDAKEAYFKGPFVVQIGNGETQAIAGFDTLVNQLSSIQTAQQHLSDLQSQQSASVSSLTSAEEQLVLAQNQATDLNLLITAVQNGVASAFPGGDSTAVYLEMLGDLKASFNPGATFSGHYRYYSASHPDPAQQGQKTLGSVSEASISKGPSAQAGSETLLENVDRVLGFNNVGTGVEMTEIRVTTGLPIMAPGQKIAIPTPTHKITTLSFAQHIIDTSQKSYGNAGVPAASFPANAVSKPLLSYLKRFLSNQLINDTTTVDSVFSTIFQERMEVLTTYASPATYSITVPTLDTVLENLGGEMTVSSALGAGAPEKASRIAAAIAGVIGGTAASAYTSRYKTIVFEHGVEGTQGPTSATAQRDAYKAIRSSWSAFLTAIAPGEKSQGSNSIKVKRGSTKPSSKEVYTPVFPVSDERGYEVVGSYRYGRGLSIEVGGSFDRLMQDDATRLDAATVDEFLVELFNSGDYGKAVGTLDPDKRAAISAAIGNNTVTTGHETLDPKQGEGALENGLMARASNSNQFTQKVNPVNAAFGLADLGANLSTRTVCACSSPSELLFLALGSEFVDVTTEETADVVTEFLSDLAVQSSMSWKASQDALRGQSLVSGVQGVLPAARSGVTAISDAATDLVAASNSLADDIANFAQDTGLAGDIQDLQE